jgi:hypothetical protein
MSACSWATTIPTNSAAQSSGLHGFFLAQDLFGPARPSPADSDMPSFDGATAWINSAPLSQASLKGKVVLVEFWTYSCINWRR